MAGSGRRVLPGRRRLDSRRRARSRAPSRVQVLDRPGARYRRIPAPLSGPDARPPRPRRSGPCGAVGRVLRGGGSQPAVGRVARPPGHLRTGLSPADVQPSLPAGLAPRRVRASEPDAPDLFQGRHDAVSVLARRGRSGQPGREHRLHLGVARRLARAGALPRAVLRHRPGNRRDGRHRHGDFRSVRAALRQQRTNGALRAHRQRHPAPRVQSLRA